MSYNKPDEIRKDDLIRFRVNPSKKARYKKRAGERGFKRLAPYIVSLLEKDLPKPSKKVKK